MSKNKVFKPSGDWIKKSHVDSLEKYEKIYHDSVSNPDEFWGTIADRLKWYKKWDSVSDVDYKKADIKWFLNGKLNVSYNCLDRHVEEGNGDKTAIIWEGNDPAEDKKYSYSELLIEVKKFMNVLKSNGVIKGDRVCLYMQMIPELAIAMLACCRIEQYTLWFLEHSVLIHLEIE